MAEFLAYRVMQGKLTFEQVPNNLKARVKEILIECGCEDLVK